jgi:hypothetical protein
MDHDIRAARLTALERYLQNEVAGRPHEEGADSKIYSMFLTWYTEPYMADSRIRTVALAKRMLHELNMETNSEVHG